MNIQLYNEERIRLHRYPEQKLFVDVVTLGAFSDGISFLFSELFYHEFRLKMGIIKVFSFPSKKYSEDFDFGYYDDAEILYILNKN